MKSNLFLIILCRTLLEKKWFMVWFVLSHLERFRLVSWNSRAPLRNGARTAANHKRRYVKGELRPEISLLHMKVLTLIKAKSNVFL